MPRTTDTATAFPNLFSPLPYSVAAHTSRQLAAALAGLAAREPVDLWHCEWTPYAQSLRFDAIGVTFDFSGRLTGIEHLEGAF